MRKIEGTRPGSWDKQTTEKRQRSQKKIREKILRKRRESAGLQEDERGRVTPVDKKKVGGQRGIPRNEQKECGEKVRGSGALTETRKE